MLIGKVDYKYNGVFMVGHGGVLHPEAPMGHPKAIVLSSAGPPVHKKYRLRRQIIFLVYSLLLCRYIFALFAF